MAHCPFIPDPNRPASIVCPDCGVSLPWNRPAGATYPRQRCDPGRVLLRQPSPMRGLQERRHLARTVPGYDVDLGAAGFYVVDAWTAWPASNTWQYIHAGESLVMRRHGSDWILVVDVPSASATYRAEERDDYAILPAAEGWPDKYPQTIHLVRVRGDGRLPATIDAERLELWNG
jgi:hypothetical protein